MKAIVLAGGKGSRLAPYTKILPKPLMPLGDKPILEILIKQMKLAGIHEIILTVGHLSELIKTYFGYGEKLGVEIIYSHESIPLGTAGPLSLIKGLDETFLVTNGDVLCDISINDFVDYHKKSKAIATIAMFERTVNIELGVMQLEDGKNRISGYLEKPSYVYPVSMGIYIFEPEALKYIPHNQYFDFPELVLKMIANGEKVMGYPFDGYWRDLGHPGDYEEAAKDFVENQQMFLGDKDSSDEVENTVI